MLVCVVGILFFFQAEDGIRDLVRSRGLGDVYKRQSASWWLTENTLRLASRRVVFLEGGEQDYNGCRRGTDRSVRRAVSALSLIHI